jgi:nucleotide-binding universal stress UspA family protein
MDSVGQERRKFRLMIAFDGSAGARAAVEDLERAGLPPNVEALVLACADVPVSPPCYPATVEGGLVLTRAAIEAVREAAERDLARARSVAAAGAELVASLFPAWRVCSEAKAGPAYWSIVERADDWGAELIVLGSYGRAALGRFFFGSVAQQVLSHAACSVRVGRTPEPSHPGPRRGDGVRLLLAVDGSADSQAAVEALCRREWPAGSEVRVVTVADQRLSIDLVVLNEPAPRPASSPIQRLVDSVGDRLRGCRLTVTTLLLEGDPKSAILQEAHRWGPDCIVLGAQGHSRLRRILIGSVSASVAARAPCAVEVVRRSV